MPTTDPLDVLLAHDAWATRKLLTLCRPLPREQFHRTFDIGLGSLHENFTHIISATRRWTDRLAGRQPRPFLHNIKDFPHLSGDARDRSVDELLTLHEEAAADLAATAAHSRTTGFANTIILDWPGKDGGKKRYTFTHAAALIHVTTHAMHHRSQCLNMMKQLKVPGLSDQLPDPSAVDWQAEVELPPVVV